MTWLLIYLAVGAANYAQFAARGNALLLNRPKRRDGDSRAAGAAEAAFFLLAWPVQLLFFVLVGVNAATGAILGRITR